MEVNYTVSIEEFAESHYIKNFRKKYKEAWTVTFKSVVEQLERVDMFLQTEKAEIITDTGDIKIVKTKFRVHGTKDSAKTSGNRCIILIDEKIRQVRVLFVYTKTDISGTNETSTWKKILRGNYKDLKDYFRE